MSHAVKLTGVTKFFKRSTLQSRDLKDSIVNLLFLRSGKKVRIHEVLKGINLTVDTGETIGIIGRNGSGKSTLLKILSGIYRPNSGTVDVVGRLSALIELGAGFHPEFTGSENIFINGIILGLTKRQINSRFDEIVAFAGLEEFIDDPVKTYSSGMYMRLAFSIAINVDPDILIIDEVLAVGDAEFLPRCMAAMDAFKDRGKTIILVTHDLNTVENWCNRAIWIDDGVVASEGDPKEIVQQYRDSIPG
jgi:homopolymeric O-antigen transport system ATP-binding protein